jgi:hypothetical protein
MNDLKIQGLHTLQEALQIKCMKLPLVWRVLSFGMWHHVVWRIYDWQGRGICCLCLRITRLHNVVLGEPGLHNHCCENLMPYAAIGLFWQFTFAYEATSQRQYKIWNNQNKLLSYPTYSLFLWCVSLKLFSLQVLMDAMLGIKAYMQYLHWWLSLLHVGSCVCFMLQLLVLLLPFHSLLH